MFDLDYLSPFFSSETPIEQNLPSLNFLQLYPAYPASLCRESKTAPSFLSKSNDKQGNSDQEDQFSKNLKNKFGIEIDKSNLEAQISLGKLPKDLDLQYFQFFVQPDEFFIYSMNDPMKPQKDDQDENQITRMTLKLSPLSLPFISKYKLTPLLLSPFVTAVKSNESCFTYLQSTTEVRFYLNFILL